MAPGVRSLDAFSPRFRDLAEAVRRENGVLTYRAIFHTLADPKEKPPAEFDDPGLEKLGKLQKVATGRAE